MCHTGQQLSEDKTEDETTTSSAPRPAAGATVAAQPQSSVDSSSYSRGMSRDDESFPSSSEQGKSLQGDSALVAARTDLVVKNIIECELSGDEALQETVEERGSETAAAVQFGRGDGGGDIDSDGDLQADLGEMREESRQAADLLASEATASSVYHEDGAASAAAAGAIPSVAFTVQPPSFEEEEEERRMSQELHEVTEIATEFVTDIEAKAIAKAEEIRRSQEELNREEATKVATEFFTKELEPKAVALAEQISPSREAELLESVTRAKEEQEKKKSGFEPEFSTDFASETELKCDLLEFREEARQQQRLLEFKEQQQQQQQQQLQQQEQQQQQQQGLNRQPPTEELIQFSNSDGAQAHAEPPGSDPSSEPDDEQKKREEEPFLGVRVESSRLQIEEELKTTTLGTSSTTSIPQTSQSPPSKESDEKISAVESPVRMQLSAHSEDIWYDEAKAATEMIKEVPSRAAKRSDNESTSKSTAAAQQENRRSGTDFECLSSSEGTASYATAPATEGSKGATASHSRTSSDVDQMFSAMSGRTSSSNLTTTEYETAHSSKCVTSTSQEFFTAESTLTSRSLDVSESSGNLGSIEISERTESDLSGAETMLDSDRDLVTPTGPPLDEPLRQQLQQQVELAPPPGSALLRESSDTDAADEEDDEMVSNMKRSHEMMFTDEDIAAHEDIEEEPYPSKRLSESKDDDNLSGSVLTISSGSDATIISAEKKQQQELQQQQQQQQQQKLDKVPTTTIEMTRSGLTDSTSSSISQPAVMSSGPTPMSSSGGDVLSSIEEFKRDESEVAVVSSPRVVSFEQTTTTVSFDIPEWQVQKSFDSESFESRPESELKNLESRPQSLSEAALSRSSSEEPRPTSKTSFTEAGNLKVDEPYMRPSTPQPPVKIEAMAADDDVFEERSVEVELKKSSEQGEKLPVKQTQQEQDERAPLLEEEELMITSPPPTETRPLGGVEYWPKSEEDGAKTLDEEKLVESPVRMRRDRDVEEGKMWIEKQFEGGVDPEAERDDALVGDGEDFFYSPPLDQIQEEDESGQEQQLERLKESIASAAPNLAVRGPPVMFQVRGGGGADDTASVATMSSLQEFEKLEASVGDRGSQDSLEAGPIRPQPKKLKGDAISIDSSVSLREFESLEQACKEATKTEKMAKEQEEVLSEIEEGHESQSESAETISHDDQRSEDDNSDDFEERMFEIDEIIKQAQTNVEQFGAAGSVGGQKGAVKGGAAAARPEMLPLEEIIGRPDSRTESTGVDKTATPDSEDSLEAPDLPAAEAAAAAGQLMQTSVDSLELNKRHVAFEEDVMQTSADSLELNKSGGVPAVALMTMSTDSIEGDKTRKQSQGAMMMEQSTDSLEGNGRVATAAAAAADANMDARLGNGAKTTAMEASTDSLEGVRTSAAAEDTIDVTHGGQVSLGHSVTEVIRASRGDFGHVIERTVEQPADVSRVVFRGPNSDVKLADYLANLGSYETVQETEYVDARTGCAVTKKVVSLRTFVEGGGVDEQTVEEYDEFGNLDKRFVLRSTSVPETVEVCRTIELISERAAAATHQASRVVRQIAGIFGIWMYAY